MWLRITDGRDTGQTVELSGESFSIGRADDCDLTLDDDQVSRHHANLRPAQAEGLWVIEDSGTRNGTFVEGQRIDRPVLLQGEEKIRVGATTMVAKLHDPNATMVQRPAAPSAHATAEAPVVVNTGPTIGQRAAVVSALLVVAAVAIGVGAWISNRDEDELRAKAERASTVVLERTTEVHTSPEIIDTAGSTPIEVAYDVIETFVQDNHRYWDGTFEANGEVFTTKFSYIGEGQIERYDYQATCGGEDIVRTPALYCEGDDFVHFFAEELVPLLEDESLGEPALIFVIGHVYGHAVSTGLGGDADDPARADCFLGAWVADLESRNALRDVDSPQLLRDMLAATDEYSQIEFFADGDDTARAERFDSGYEDGVSAC